MGTEPSAVQDYTFTSDKFTVEQTKVISSLAFYLRITGMLISALGLFLCAAVGLFSLNSLGGILIFIIGVLFIRAAASFQQLSAAERYDLLQLMDALTTLRDAHRLITEMLILMLLVYLGITLYMRWSG
jgi:hypothetical protein